MYECGLDVCAAALEFDPALTIWFWLYFSQGQCVNIYMCLWRKNLLPIMWCYQGFKRGFVFCFWQQLFSCTVPVVFLSTESSGGDRGRVAMWGGMIQYDRGEGAELCCLVFWSLLWLGSVISYILSVTIASLELCISKVFLSRELQRKT